MDGGTTRAESTPPLATTGRIALTALLTAVALETVLRTATRVFVLNFSIAGPNATALLMLLLVTGWSLLVVARLDADGRPLYLGGTALVVVGLGASALDAPVVSAVGAVLALTAATPLLVGLLAALRERVAVGLGLGTLLFVAVRVWLDTAPPYATTGGTLALVALAAGLLAATAVLDATDGYPSVGWDGLAVSAAPLAAFLFAQALSLASPHVVASQSGWPSLPTLALASLGLLAGIAVVALCGVPTRRVATAAGAAYVLGSAVLLAVDHVAAVLALPVVEAAAVALLAVGSRTRAWRSTRRTTIGLVNTQLAAVVLVFLVVAAINWAFMPVAVGSLTRGNAAAFVFLTLLLLPFVVATGARETAGWGASVDPDRRSTLAAVATGALGLAGVARPTTDATPDDDGPPYTVATFNVHQYFDGTSDGSYNLGPVRDTVAEMDAHLVGLQETTGTRVTSGNVDGLHWLADHLGYHVARGPDAGSGSYGVALLSAWPILDERVVYPPVYKSAPRPLLVVTVDAPDGPLPVVVAHFQTQQRDWGAERNRNSVQAQRDQADRLLDLVADEDRAVVLGDFNSRPGDDAYDRLAGDLTDAWAAANPDADGYTWSAREPDRRIDHVFLHGSWRVASASVHGRPAASDHLAVAASVAPQDGS